MSARGRELETLLASAPRLFDQTTADGVYAAAGDIVRTELGRSCLIMVKENGFWVAKQLPFDDEAAALADRLLGRSPFELRYPVGSLPFMDVHGRSGKAKFQSDSVEDVGQLMREIEKTSGAEAVRMVLDLSDDFFAFIRQPVVEAPLAADGEVYGTFAIYGPDLEEDDLPLAEAAAKLVSSAVEGKLPASAPAAVSRESALSAIESVRAEHAPDTDAGGELPTVQSMIAPPPPSHRSVKSLERARLAEVVRSAFEAMRSGLDAAGIAASFEVNADPEVEVDRAAIAQVVVDLVDNARQAMTDVGAGKLSVAVGSANARAYFSVADNGCGMSAQKMRRVFTPLRGAMPDSGGPGLSAANSAVANHGGWICVESAEGAGSTFTVWLPIRQDVAPGQAGRGARVLILDDEADLARSMGECLRAEGYEVEEFQSGADALARHGGQPFDLVLLDLQMPEMDGFTFLEKLRGLPGRQPEVVVISGRPLREMAPELARHGVRRWVQKPFNLDALSMAAADSISRPGT